MQYERTQPWTFISAINIAGATGGIPIVFSNVNAAPAYTGYEVFVYNGLLRARIISNFGAANYLDVQGSTNLLDRKWHVVAASYDGSSTAAGVKLYVDGNAEFMTTIKDALSGTIVNSNPFYIGNQSGYTASYQLNGGMGYFTLSNVVRSSAYIGEYSTSASIPPVDASTALSYSFGEGAGTTTADASANGYTGTLSSASMWLA